MSFAGDLLTFLSPLDSCFPFFSLDLFLSGVEVFLLQDLFRRHGKYPEGIFPCLLRGSIFCMIFLGGVGNIQRIFSHVSSVSWTRIMKMIIIIIGLQSSSSPLGELARLAGRDARSTDIFLRSRSRSWKSSG